MATMPLHPTSIDPGFGAFLRRRRTAAALSQQDLADRSGLSVRGISDLERGIRRTPHPETVRLLADALGLTGPDRHAFARAARPDVVVRPSAPGPCLPAVFPSPLLGRDAELADIARLLGNDGPRLITLTGPGGVGKTSLARHAANRVAGEFDRIDLVALAPLDDHAQVPGQVARTLGVRTAGDPATIDGVAAVLGAGRALLVLDNMEHLLDAAPYVGYLLDRAPALRVLVTSRERLSLGGERIVPVAPLATEADGPGPAPAVSLFLDRAFAANPGRTPNPADVPVIADICRRLDGLPLAIELAASRSATLTPAALRSRIQHRLPLLTGGRRDLPERLRTMRDAIAWSVDLLDDGDRATLRRLAVFAGGWTLESGESVADPDGSLGFLDRLGSLVNKSLVRQREQPDGLPRFDLLETIREYALGELAASGEEAAVRERHAAAFVAFGRRMAAANRAGNPRNWLAAAEAEFPNVSTAFDWLLAAGRAGDALRLCLDLGACWWIRGPQADELGRLDRVLDAGLAPASLQAAALIQAGGAGCALGQCADGRVRVRRGLALAEALGDDANVARAHFHLGLCAEFAGDDREALARYERALDLARSGPDATFVAGLLEDLSDTCYRLGDGARARRLGEEALEVLATLDNAILAAIGQIVPAWLDTDAGELDSAFRRRETELRLALDLGDPWFIGNALVGFAGIAQAAGDPATAARLLGAADRQRVRSGRSAHPFRFQHERLEAAVRAVLDDARWATCFAAGRAMADGEAIALARAVRPSPVA